MLGNSEAQEKWFCIDLLPWRYLTCFLVGAGGTDRLWLLLNRLHHPNELVAMADAVEVMEC